MGVMDWFRRLAGGSADNAETVPAPDDKGAELGGLNFKSAVDAHMRWKVRLESYINGTSEEDLQVDVICRDDQCPLGKWIYGEGGNRFGFTETFYEMRVHHAHFHTCAGNVLRAAQAGDKPQALQLLHHGDYLRASERVKMLLARLFVLVADGKEAVDAHIKWKDRLHDYVAGRSSEPLQADLIVQEDHCVLGQWLKGAGQERYGQSPEFLEVRARHARFHECAGKVVALTQMGRREEALAMLEAGEYEAASEEVTAALVTLFEVRNAS